MGKLLDFPVGSAAIASANMLDPLEQLQKEILAEKVSCYGALAITAEGPKFWYMVHPEADIEDVMLLMASADILQRDLNDVVCANLDPDPTAS